MLLRLFQGFPAPESSSEDAAAEENGAAVPDIFRYTPCNDSAGSMHMQRKTGIVPEGFPGMPAAGQRRIGVWLYAACWVGYNHPCSLFFCSQGGVKVSTGGIARKRNADGVKLPGQRLKSG